MQLKFWQNTLVFVVCVWISCCRTKEEVICSEPKNIICSHPKKIRVHDVIYGHVVGRNECNTKPTTNCTAPNGFCEVAEKLEGRGSSESLYSRSTVDPPPCRGKDIYIIVNYSCRERLELSGKNFALKKPAQQSKTTSNGFASRAVDGNTNNYYFSGSCTHTDIETTPWWRVDLKNRVAVTHVKIVNRNEIGKRLCGFEIRIGDSLVNNGTTNPRCGTRQHIPSNQEGTVSCDPAVVGRYVTVVIPGEKKTLTLCEVEVYGSNVLEPLNPVVISYSSLRIMINKPATYIKEVMVIVQIATSSPTPSEDIETSELKPDQTNIMDPYVTAYLKADVLPLTFVIGDGKEYNSEKEKYFNQPLKKNSSYMVFLRFFESQDSYYSTEWSNTVTFPVEFVCDDIKTPKRSSDEKTPMDLLIPLIILSLCFLLSLGVIIYQRRLIHSKKGRAKRKVRTISQHQQKLDSISTKGDHAVKKTALTNDNNVVALYEIPSAILECNESGSSPEIYEYPEPSAAYVSLNDNRDPPNVYQSLQPVGTSADPRQTCP